MTVATNNDRFIHVASETYPLYLYQIPQHDPNLSLPVGVTLEALSNAGYELVQPTVPPVGDVVTEGAPSLADGVYTQVWVVRPFTPEEKEAHFQIKKADAESSVNQLFFTAQDTGAEVSIAGIALPQHFGLSEIQRTDYAAMKARAQRAVASDSSTALIQRTDYAAMKARAQRAVASGSSTALILHSKEGVSVRLAPAKMVELCIALEDYFYDLQLAYYDLLDQVSLAEALEELPTLPAAITADARVIA